MQSRFNDPAPNSPPPSEPSSAQFLSTSPLQDPTLRTPGSEIPESIYAASDSQPLPTTPPDLPDHSKVNTRNSYRLALVLALALAAVVITAVCLLRYVHHAAPDPAPPQPVHASARPPGD